MKSFLLVLLLLSKIGHDIPAELNGKWKLVKVEINAELIFPEKVNYYLTISDNKVEYNLEKNHCWANILVDNKNIFMNVMACTEICCDGRYDTISNYINYNGEFHLKDSILSIVNNKGTLFLKKQDVEID